MKTIRTERNGPLLVVTIDHPGHELNLVDEVLHRELVELMAGLRRETEARAVVLAGTEHAFSAGGDIRWFAERRDPGQLADLAAAGRSIITDLLEVPVPVIAAIRGPAVGLGASIALLCDMVVMADDATLSDPHVRVGLVAGDGGTVIWPLVCGPARAKEHLLTGRPVDAVSAEHMGLVNRVVAATAVLATAIELAEEVAALPPLAVRYTKQAVNAWVRAAAGSSFEMAAASELSTFMSHDHAEAVDAFLEHRPGTYEGR